MAGRLKLVDLLGLAPLGILKPPLSQLQAVLSLPQPRDVLARLRGCTLLLKNSLLTHPLQLRLGCCSPARRECSLVEWVACRLRVEFLPSELVHVGRAKFIVGKHPVRLVQDHEGVRRAWVIALVRVHVKAGLAEGSGDCRLAPLLYGCRFQLEHLPVVSGLEDGGYGDRLHGAPQPAAGWERSCPELGNSSVRTKVECE